MVGVSFLNLCYQGGKIVWTNLETLFTERVAALLLMPDSEPECGLRRNGDPCRDGISLEYLTTESNDWCTRAAAVCQFSEGYVESETLNAGEFQRHPSHLYTSISCSFLQVLCVLSNLCIAGSHSSASVGPDTPGVWFH